MWLTGVLIVPKTLLKSVYASDQTGIVIQAVTALARHSLAR